MEVIIPALNEEKTIYNIVHTFKAHQRIGNVIVMIDDKTNDNTESEARLAGAETLRLNGITGKGQLIRWGTVGMDEERVILSDGDYTRINKHVVEMVASPQVTGMRVIVPRFPGAARWNASGFPAPFHATAWAVNSGLRNVPFKLIEGQVLHGFLTETQLNKKAQEEGIEIELIQVDSLIAPLRFTDARLNAMEDDRKWGIAHGVLQPSNSEMKESGSETDLNQSSPRKEDQTPKELHSLQTGD